uniref:tRNA pseudouridine(55) synthase TruB n=1 Tax=Kroppenstedtia sanguinis TaxID=1380684 RepID=UPI003D1D4481
MMLHGVIPVNKPAGLTSHDVVNRLRRLSGQKKVGHTGTLDPAVEGVLPICLGQATRIAEYIQSLPKRYRGTLTLGVATDTEDQTGEVLEEQPVGPLEPERIDAVFRKFTGEIEQIPPMYSAVKVEGKRLYEWARQGQQVQRRSRRVTIYSLERTGMEEGEQPRIHFDVRCSKGTYVRSLCVDVGKELGYPAHMSRLIRTESGPFMLEEAFDLDRLEQVANSGEWGSVLTGIGEALRHLPELIVPQSLYTSVMNGRLLHPEQREALATGTLFRVSSEEGQFCALYRMKDEGTAKPEKVFRVR